ncbi:DotD/TraH family lipoprotein [Enterobacter ludwigii]|uniref:DotD/TraH family lipoprotein n=1 Tax=Enterobacter TaxID=547 RepID=UPI003BEEF928
MKRLLTLLAPVCLAACQTPPPRPPDPTALTAAGVQATQARQQLLAQSGVLNTPALAMPDPIAANSQRVCIDWDGDAVELLSQLAYQRGLNFAYTGVRLPLPVSVHVRDITFNELLRLLGPQINWRARIDQEPLRLRLDFMLPLSGVLA